MDYISRPGGKGLMIESFKHKGLKKLYEDDSRKGG